MHSFLIDMCRSCLTANVNLREYMVVEDKEIKCFDAVKIIFPNTVVPAYCEYGYSLCELCVHLLKSVVVFHSRLSESHNAYSKYMETLNLSNHCKLSIVIFQQINNRHLLILKTDEGSRLKLTENTGNQIPTGDTYFQDILNDEDLNCDTYNDFDNSLSELDTKRDKKENISINTSQEECKNMDSVIDDSKKKEVIADNDRCYQLDSKIEVKEEYVVPWESTKNGHVNFESVYDCEEQGKYEILANISATDFKQEKTTTINIEECEASPILLIKHKVEHKRKQHHKCDVCGKSFFKNSHLIVHKRFHTAERTCKCNVCKKSFFFSSHLIVHKRIHTGEQPYKCDVCGKSFSTISNCNKHKRIHCKERPYKCDVCGRSFLFSSDLIRHKRIHSGEQPYKCDVCGKSFSTNSNYNKHKRIHSKERPYKCGVCGRSFRFSSNLIRHKHIHTGELPYNCNVCKKSFLFSSHLIVHKRIHTGEQPYKCDVCGKSFSTISNCNKHKHIHAEERPYKCDDCGKSFSYNSNFIKHKRIHIKERPYK